MNLGEKYNLPQSIRKKHEILKELRIIQKKHEALYTTLDISSKEKRDNIYQKMKEQRNQFQNLTDEWKLLKSSFYGIKEFLEIQWLYIETSLKILEILNNLPSNLPKNQDNRC